MPLNEVDNVPLLRTELQNLRLPDLLAADGGNLVPLLSLMVPEMPIPFIQALSRCQCETICAQHNYCNGNNKISRMLAIVLTTSGQKPNPTECVLQRGWLKVPSRDCMK